MTRTLPMTSPMAALRTMRKGAWWSVAHAELTASAASLSGPMADLSASWNAVQSALGVYRLRQDAEGYDRLQRALMAFDEALGVFLGPSGWEVPDP